MVRGVDVVLAGVDFTLRAGEVAVVQGPSGGGKSTFLRALARLQPLTAGRLEVDGAPADGMDVPRYRAAIQYVPQVPVMFAGTVADNVRAGPALRGARLTDEAVDRLLARAALDPALRLRPARDLSGGEKQRLAVARALALAPRALLLDEPTSALDPSASREVLALITRCAREGCGVVAVTHQAEHAAALGGTDYLCAAGRLMRAGAP